MGSRILVLNPYDEYWTVEIDPDDLNAQLATLRSLVEVDGGGLGRIACQAFDVWCDDNFVHNGARANVGATALVGAYYAPTLMHGTVAFVKPDAELIGGLDDDTLHLIIAELRQHECYERGHQPDD